MNWLERASTWLEMYGNTHALETDSLADTTSNTCIFWLRRFKWCWCRWLVCAFLHVWCYIFNFLRCWLATFLCWPEGHLPCSTAGSQSQASCPPGQLSYAGQPITGHLSTRPAGNHFNLLYIVSLIFQVAVIILKKAKMRRVSTSTNLRDIIVNNYLNIFSLLVIIGIMLLLSVTVLFHSAATTVTSTHWKSILVIGAMETLVQSVAFINSPALRWTLARYWEAFILVFISIFNNFDQFYRFWPDFTTVDPVCPN